MESASQSCIRSRVISTSYSCSSTIRARTRESKVRCQAIRRWRSSTACGASSTYSSSSSNRLIFSPLAWSGLQRGGGNAERHRVRSRSNSVSARSDRPMTTANRSRPRRSGRRRDFRATAGSCSSPRSSGTDPRDVHPLILHASARSAVFGGAPFRSSLMSAFVMWGILVAGWTLERE